MKRDTKILLEDILENIELIKKSANKINKESFLKNRMLQDATVRRLEIIGEAIKNIPKNIKEKHPEIEWKKVIGTRDIIIHAYFRIDLDIVWGIIEKDLIDLEKKILKIKEELENKKDNKKDTSKK